jgi:hypothetical protein
MAKQDELMFNEDLTADSGDKRARTINILTLVVLGATVCLIGFYGLVALNVFNPFTPPPTPTLFVLPTPTITPTTRVPTWTPTTSPTITPTPGPTTTRTPTLTPSVTPTFPPTSTPMPTATPTPEFDATRSPLPFTYEVSLDSPEYGCSWTGVAGHVQDIRGNPLPGYLVRVWGGGIDVVLYAGTEQRFNTIYGSQAAWEQFFDSKPKPMQVRVQLHDPYRDDHPPISEEVVIDFPGYCGGALAYVVFTLNPHYE